MVLGFVHARLPLDAELAQVAAQLRERLLHQEPGQVPGPVRHDLAATDADEQRVVLVPQLLEVGACSGHRQHLPRRGEQAVVVGVG